MIKEYLENDFREDLKKVFDTEPRREDGYFAINRQCFCQDSECRIKNKVLSKEKPERHFVLSGLFLFYLALSVAKENESYYNHTLTYYDVKNFYDLTGWPEFFFDDILNHVKENFEEVFLPEDVNYILDHFGLMRNGIPNRSREFMLSSIFATMQGLLNEAFQEWNDVSNEVKVGLSEKVRLLLDRIQNVLKAGYKPIEPEQEQENNLYSAPDDVFEDIY